MSNKNLLLERMDKMRIIMDREKLRRIFESFDAWYRSDDHSVRENSYRDTLTKDKLTQMSKEELVRFFYDFKASGGGIQSGGHRGKNLFKAYIENNFEKFREFILDPFSQNFDVAKWIKRLKEFKNFGRGAATTYLNRIDNKRFSIFNNKTKDALGKMGIDIDQGKLDDVYLQVIAIQQKVIEDLPEFENLYKLDALNHFIIGVEEGVRISNEIFNRKRTPKMWIEKTILKNRPERHEDDKKFSTTLFSPQAGKDGRDTYALMRDIQIEDIILHFVDNQDFIGVSKVVGDLEDDYTETDPESEYYGKDCYSIELGSYQELEARINRQDLFGCAEFQQSLMELLETPHKLFFNKHLELNQGAYLTEVPEKLIQMLNTLHKRKVDKLIPRLEHWGCFTTESYWIFQANPQIYDFAKALNENAIREWWVKSHKDKITIGDKGIIWATGASTGCYAFFEITSELYEKGEDADQKQYYKKEMKWDVGTKVGIKIEKNISNSPILKESVKDLDWFQDFNGGNQGTTFQMSKVQYQGFLSMIDSNNKPQHWMIASGHGGEFWPEFQTLNRISIGWGKLGDHRKFNSREEIESEYMKLFAPEKRPTNNTLCIWQFSKEIKKGDIVFVKKGQTTFLAAAQVISERVDFDGEKNDHQMFHEVKWLKIQDHELDDGPVTPKSLTNIEDDQKFVKKLRSVYEIDRKNTESTFEGGSSMKNQILYGPPGTGKTYETIDRAVFIASGRKSSNHKENKIIFDQLKKEKQIGFVTFHQNYSYEDFVIGLRPDPSEDNLRFYEKEGIFFEFSERARKNYEASKDGSKITRTFEDVFSEFLSPLDKNEPIQVKMASGGSFTITGVSERTIYFDKQSEGSKHTLRIETLKELVNNERDTILGLKSYYTPLVNMIREKMIPQTRTNVEQRKNYVLIIDEINRANISKVFGELITLLEEDKRIDGDNAMSVMLPNGKDFSVPPNLYIIGTMNTADKSIAFIDIALRRRFEFEGIYPKYDINEFSKDKGIFLRALNKNIQSMKKSSDYLIGHAYFLNNNTIEDVLKRKIIPLLMEYFSNKIDFVCGVFQ